MGTTPIFTLPYPELTDPPDGAGQIKALALAAESSLQLAARPVLSTARPPPAAGALIFETDTGRMMVGVSIAGTAYWSPMPGTPVFAARQTTGQSVPEGGGALQFQTIDRDIFGWWVTGTPTRFNPKIPGWYQLTGGVGHISNQTGYRAAQWTKNGTGVLGGYCNQLPSTISTAVCARPTTVYFNGTSDYIELWSVHPVVGGLSTNVTGGYQSTMNAAYCGP